MAFARKGFHALQNKMDEVLPVCPCCGKNAVWMTESRNGFSTVSCKFKCQQCGAVFSTEYDWKITNWNHVVTYTESGSGDNVLALELGRSYYCGELHGKLLRNEETVFEDRRPQATPLSVAEYAEVKEKTAAKRKKTTVIVVISIILSVTFGLVCGFAYDALSSISSDAEESGPLTYENFCKISEGMSYSAVCDLLGGEGTYVSGASSGGYSYVIYSWSNYSGTKVVTVGFDNGKVSSKAQIGLQ